MPCLYKGYDVPFIHTPLEDPSIISFECAKLFPLNVIIITTKESMILFIILFI